METKFCSKCAISKNISEYPLNKSCRGGREGVCKTCRSRSRKPVNHKAHYQKYKEKHKARSRQWRAANPEKSRSYWAKLESKPDYDPRAWEKRNPDRAKEAKRLWARDNLDYSAKKKAGIASLSNHYLAELLGSSVAKLPPELIEAKRVHLQIHRLLRDMTK